MAAVNTSIGFSLNYAKKRPRCNNFTPQEKNVLFSLVEKYRDVITSKKTDRAAIEEKDNAWQSITHEFNSILGYDLQNNAGSQPKSLKNLRCCYDNFRKKKNKDCSEIIFIKQENIDIDDYEHGTCLYDNTTLQENSESRTSNESNFFDIRAITSSTILPTTPPADPCKVSVIVPCTTSSVVSSTASSAVQSIASPIVPSTTSSIVPSTTSPIASKKSDQIFVKKQINRLYSKCNKSRKSRNMILKLKTRLLKRELELKELELATQSRISDLKMKVQKAKLEFYEKKREMLNANCDSRDN